MTCPSDITEWDRRHHWHAFTQMAEYEGLVIDRAEGCWLFDCHGRRYLDGVSSMWCNLLGHRHPRVDAALRRQLDQVAHNTSLGMGNSTTAVLAKRLADLAPGDLEHVFFSGDGSSAVESALKMAFQYWRQIPNPQPAKTKYLALGEAYHGDTIGSASVGGIDRFTEVFTPLFFDVIRLPPPSDRHDAMHYLQQLERTLAAHHHELAAMVLEPLVQAAAGILLHPPGYLAGVRELTRKYDVLLIADEIVTAFGRTGRMFACEHEDVVPDLLCLGKSITAGYLPLSATIARSHVYDTFLGSSASGRMFAHGHTYGGNPLAAAAALAMLDVHVEERVLDKVPAKAQRLADMLKNLLKHPRVATTRQLGLIAALELTPSEDRSARYPTETRIGWRVYAEALQHGVWLRPLSDVLVIMPPLVINDRELDFLGSVLEASIDAATR